MSRFQIIIIGIMMALVLIAVLMLGGVIPGFKPGGGGGGKAVSLIMWGTIPHEQIREPIESINAANGKIFNINYIEKNPGNYQSELIDALASGKGPDIWIISQDLILKNKDKIFLIPFESFSERAFKDTFIEAGELYLSKNGIVALPFVIDPLVLYWNRDLASNAGISLPPKTWDEFVNFSRQLTIKDAAGNIIQSGAAFGEFQNVDHAKEIISLLLLQTGNPIVDAATLRSTLSEGKDSVALSPENAVRFFTEFSDPAKTTYSWNRSFSSSKNAFIAGTLAYYFGYASEYNDIAAKNPHLNFDVSEAPQIAAGAIRATFGRIEALAVSKSSLNVATAMLASAKFIAQESASLLAKDMFLAPARRDLLAEKISDPILSIFYKSAIYSRAWLEPDSSSVSEMFQNMIESVLTGRKKISGAVEDADTKLNTMLKKFSQ